VKPTSPAQGLYEKEKAESDAFLAAEKAGVTFTPAAQRKKTGLRFKPPTDKPAKGQRGAVGEAVHHQRWVADPGWLLPHVKEALKGPGATAPAGTNVTCKEAVEQMRKLVQQCLGECEGLEELLEDHGIELALEHGGKTLSDDILKAVHLGAFAPESYSMGFWRHNLAALHAALGDAGSLAIDLDPYRHDSNAAKGKRAAGDWIPGYGTFIRMYQKRLIPMILGWLQPAGGTITTYCETAWQMMQGKSSLHVCAVPLKPHSLLSLTMPHAPLHPAHPLPCATPH
jgi:hypothetical protein